MNMKVYVVIVIFKPGQIVLRDLVCVTEVREGFLPLSFRVVIE